MPIYTLSKWINFITGNVGEFERMATKLDRYGRTQTKRRHMATQIGCGRFGGGENFFRDAHISSDGGDYAGWQRPPSQTRFVIFALLWLPPYVSVCAFVGWCVPIKQSQ